MLYDNSRFLLSDVSKRAWASIDSKLHVNAPARCGVHSGSAVWYHNSVRLGRGFQGVIMFCDYSRFLLYCVSNKAWASIIHVELFDCVTKILLMLSGLCTYP